MRHTIRFKVKGLSGATTFRTEKTSTALKKLFPRIVAGRLKNIGFSVLEGDVEIISVEADPSEIEKTKGDE